MNSPKLDLSTSRIFGECDEDIIEAMSLIGEAVYVSDDENFEYYQKLELAGAKKVKGALCCYVAITDDGNLFCYKYFILAKDAKFEVKKEKKLRPYKDISEFCNETGCEEVGSDTIIIRDKNSKQESTLLYTGYSDDGVHLGGYILTFDILLKHYEYAMSPTEWLPFGVEE